MPIIEPRMLGLLPDDKTKSTFWVADDSNVERRVFDTNGNLFTPDGSTVASQLAQTLNYSSGQIKDYIYNFEAGLTNWFTKLATFRSISSKTLNVSVIGDSISEGNAAGNRTPSQYFENGYLGQLKSKFNESYGNAGKGFIPVYLTTGSPLWSFNGFIVETGFFGATGVTRMSQTNGDTATLSFTGTGIGIVFPKRSSGGILSVSIDGGIPVVIDEYSANEIYADKLEITGLTNGNHTLVVTSQLSLGQKVWLHGAYEIASTTGVRFNMVGRSGVATPSVSTVAALPTEIDIWNPTLTIIPLTANDYGGQTPISTYESNLQTLIDRAKLYGDVLLVSIGLEIPIENETIPQIEYVKIQKKLAKVNKVAFLDMYNLWSGDANFAKNKLGFIYDHVHPTDLGHSDIADKLYDALTYNISQGDIIATEKAMVDKGKLVSGVIGRALSNKIIKAFGHRQEITAKDLILLKHSSPINSSDSCTLIGNIRVSFSGRNSGGARAHAAKDYSVYYDNDSNMDITEVNSHSPAVLGTTVNIVVERKGTENIIQITITPSANTLTGSVFVEFDYIQSYIYDPIDVKFSSDLV